MIRILTVAFTSFALMAGAAGAETYSCRITPDSSSDFIPRTLLMNIDDRSGDILVYDDLVKKVTGKPVHGKLSAETGKRITVKWTLHQVYDDYGESSARFFFRATYYKGNGKLVMSSMPGGWDNMFGGRGKCVVTPDENWSATLENTPVRTFSARGKERFFMAGERDDWIWP